MLVDIGVNLLSPRFDRDRQEVIERAFAAGVRQIVITGTCEQSSRDGAAFAAHYPRQLFATAGIHPHDAKGVSADYIEQLRALAALPQVVAIGECGLDFNRDFSPREQQKRVFAQQLELACELQMPLFMHERDATDAMLEMLTPLRSRLSAGVIHCFTGSRSALERYLELDLYIGITGWICDERRGQELYELVSEIPEDRLLLETDAPYLLPRDIRPKPKSGRNEPAYLAHIAEVVAKARGVSFEQLQAQCRINSEQFFGLGR